MHLKRRIFVGSVWSVVGSGGQQLISVLLFIYIARRLTPSDVGVMALAMVFVEILGFVARWGQVEVIQREIDLSDRALSTSLWMLTASGIVVTALIAAGGLVSTELLDQALFGTVLLLISPIATLSALSAVPEAILKRRFDYRTLMTKSWAATILGGATGGYLAYRGFGVYALVAQRLMTVAVQTIATWTLLRWRPRLTFDFGEAARLMRAGREIMAGGFVGLLNQRIAEGMTGFALGAHELGLLRLAARLFDSISQLTVLPVSKVALSTFSQLQHDLEAMKRAYLRMTQLMALASLPMFFGLAAIANVFVPLVLGAKWAGAEVVIQLFAVTRLAGPVNYFFAPAMIAVGKARIILRQSIAQVFMTIILVGIGSFFGIIGVLAAIALRALLIGAYNIRALHREIGIEAASVLLVLLPPTIACAVMVGVVEAAKLGLAGLFAPVWLMIVLIAVGALTYGLVLLAGDLFGLWRGYVRGTVRSLSAAVPLRARASASPA